MTGRGKGQTALKIIESVNNRDASWFLVAAAWVLLLTLWGL